MAKRSGIGDFVQAASASKPTLAASAHFGLQAARALLSGPEGSTNASGRASRALSGRIGCCTPHGLLHARAV